MEDVKANILKAFFANIIFYGIPAIIFVTAIILVAELVDFSLIAESLSSVFDFQIDTYGLLMGVAKWTAMATIFFAVVKMMGEVGSSIDFGHDYAIYHKLFETKNILFDNISKVSYESGFICGLMHCGTFVLTPSGMENKEIRVNYVTDVEKKAAELQSALSEYRLKKQEELRMKIIIEGSSAVLGEARVQGMNSQGRA